MSVAPTAVDVQRANRGSQLAAAFHLAYNRRNGADLQAILDDATEDLLPFVVALASLPHAAALTALGTDGWLQYLRTVIDTSAPGAIAFESGGSTSS